MAVGYSDQESLKLTYPASIVDLLLDDKKDDGLPEEDVFDAVNGNVGIMIRHKLGKRYSDYFEAWETAPHEMVELLSDRLTIYEYYVRKGKNPPAKIITEYKAAMQTLQDIADGKEDLEGIVFTDDDESTIWPTDSGPTMTLNKRDPDTGIVTKYGSLHNYLR